MAKTTEWFPGTAKPASDRPGWYEIMDPELDNPDFASRWYDWWDGKQWLAADPVDDLMIPVRDWPAEDQDRYPWRGLAKKPK